MKSSSAHGSARLHALERQLDEAQQTIAALLAGQVDAVIDPAASTVILLRQAQEAIQRLATIVESSQDAIISVTIDGTVRTWNTAAERLFGYPAAEAIGQHLDALLPANGDGEHKALLDLTAVAKGDRHLESVRRGKNGAPIAVALSLSLVTNLAGAVLSISVIARDITARILEDEQRQMRRKLESIGRLAAGVAHEINTPIQFIGDNLNFLKDGFAKMHACMAQRPEAGPAAKARSADPREITDKELAFFSAEIPTAIKESLDGIQRVAAIIRGLKEFSHPGSPAPMPFDLNAAIESTIIISRNEHRYVADVITDLAPDLPAIVGKVNDIQQVILILIVNAAHAIAQGRPPGKGTITISTRLRGAHVEFSVSDTGPGIPEANRAHIFEPFFTTKPIGVGTGQGLYIAHDIIVNRHHGGISFASGPGATFLVELPIQPALTIE